MGIFDSDWERLHKKICHQYELIALRDLESGLSPEAADVFGIITEILRNYIPNLSYEEADSFAKKEYKSFIAFDVREIMSDAMRQINPDIPDTGIIEILEAIRNRFHNKEKEHEYFLFFVISKIIELQDLSISRGSYLFKIGTGDIPRTLRFVSFFRSWKIIARYMMAKNKIKS